MKPTAMSTLILCLTGFLSIQASNTASGQAGGGWTVLFDGKSLKGWNVVGDATWNVADGVVQADKGSGFLVTPASYGDFQITLEFWVRAMRTAASSSAVPIRRRSTRRMPTR